MAVTKKIIRTQEELQAELDRLKAENESLQANAGGVFLGEEPIIQGGMSESKGKIVKIIQQQTTKGEKISPTTRIDVGYDPTQRFAGRQP